MKGITRGFQIIIIGTILLVGNQIECKGTEETTRSLSTDITNISWSKLELVYLNENHSNFEFNIAFEISNPNNEEVTLSFPYAGSTFFGNSSISFDNRKYESYDHTWIGGLCWVGNETFQPGITKKNIKYWVSVTEQGLLELPDGRYDIWVFAHCYEPLVEYNHTIIRIRNGIADIDYNPPTTISLGIKQMGVVLGINSCLILLVINSKYKKMKRY